tara:strand:+ start:843 stop:1922 length:1080 start_codon:yes stop_codon:yes gene_type:complete
MVQSISKNWLEEQDAALALGKSSIQDFLKKYPEAIVDFDNRDGSKVNIPFGNSQKLGEARRGDTGWLWEDSKIINNPSTPENVKKAVERSIQLRKMLANPDLDPKKRKWMEEELLAYSRTDQGGRGGRAEMKLEMDDVDTGSRGEEKKPFKPNMRDVAGPVVPTPPKELTFKDRLSKLWEDGSKRNAILSGISETLLETRVGADAYGNRFRDLPKNVSDKMMQAEAIDMVKDQAMLDMIKTQAETQAAMDPRQFLSNTQKNARDFATAKGSKEGYAYGSKEWNAAYAGAIQEMTMENLLTAPVEGIAAISELLARNTGMFDESTITLFQDVISQLTSKIQGEPIGKSRSSKKIIQGGTD